jgi:hypothetical protein
MTKTSEKNENKKDEEISLNKLVGKISEDESDEAIEMIKARKVKSVLDNEKKRLKSLNKCTTPNCKGKLEGFDVNKFLMKGRKSYRLECDKCHRLHRLLIVYPDEPGLCTGELKIIPLEYAWRTNHPAIMTEEQLDIWMADEEKRVLDNKSNYVKRDDQLVIRSIAMMNRKLREMNKGN